MFLPSPVPTPASIFSFSRLIPCVDVSFSQDNPKPTSSSLLLGYLVCAFFFEEEGKEEEGAVGFGGLAGFEGVVFVVEVGVLLFAFEEVGFDGDGEENDGEDRDDGGDEFDDGEVDGQEEEGALILDFEDMALDVCWEIGKVGSVCLGEEFGEIERGRG